MLFGSRICDAETVLRAYRETVAPVVTHLEGIGETAHGTVRDGTLAFEHVFTPHKCSLAIRVAPFDPVDEAYLEVSLMPYRELTREKRRVMATLSLRGKPLPGGRMLWVHHVERHTNLNPQATQLARRYHAVERLKGLDAEEVARERLHMLVGYALHGPTSLV